MRSHFSLTEVDNDQDWDTLICSSEEGTIFCESHYLHAVEGDFKRYYVVKGQERRAAIVVMIDSEGKAALNDHVIYHGLMYAKGATNRTHAKRCSDRFQIAEYVAGVLPERHPEAVLALPPQITDMRPFLWHNYGVDTDQKWQLDHRFTSYLDIRGCGETDLEQNPLFDQLGTNTRRKLRAARRDNVHAERIDDSELLIDLFQRTMIKNGAPASPRRLVAMRSLMAHLSQVNQGALYGVADPGGEIISAIYFCWDNKRAYHLFAGNHETKRGSYAGTVAMWDAFRDMNRNGLDQVDLEGVNSPLRGRFKLSFGGELVPYFEIHFPTTS